MNITEFLLARIGEDEELARKVIATTEPDAWDNPTETGNFYPEEIAFWEHHTPYRVLAECAAKRAIIAAHRRQDEDDDPDAWIVASEVLLKSLAAVYKDHPDYQEEWAPNAV